MICLLKGNDLFLRSEKWSESDDFVWKCDIVNPHEWSKTRWFGNKFFNIAGAYTCPSTEPADCVDNLALWKISLDDSCPVKINGTYIGANHGYYCCDQVTVPSHDKSEADIGSVWIDEEGKSYCLVKIPDEDTLCFVKFDEESMATGRFDFGRPENVLFHKSGAQHIGPVCFTERVDAQLYQSFNHYTVKLLTDEQERSVNEDFLQKCDTVTVETAYDIIYVPAMLRYLMERVGSNTNASQCSDEIGESYLRLYVRHVFCENGTVSTYCSFDINKDIDLQYFGLVQSMRTAEAPYAYIPDTVYDQLTPQDGTQTFWFYRDSWNSEQKAPYRYYQFKDSSCKEGMALAFDRNYGWGSNEMRLSRLDYAGMYYRTRKQYPAFISGGKLEAGMHIDGFAARMPLSKRDSDLTAMCWYYINDEIVLMLDTHKAVDKDVDLPDSLIGRKMEIHDSSASCDLSKLTLDGNKLHISFDGYGYLVLRLRK